MKMKDMTSGNPLKLILFFSVPILFGNVFQQLYLMADTMIVGQFLGVDPLAAMGASTTVANLVIGFCNGMATGVGILVAQFFGARNERGMKQATAGSYVICFSASILLCVISIALARPILLLLKTPASILDMAALYLVIIMAGIVVTMLYNLFASLLRCVGDAKTPLYFLIIASILNVVLDYVLVAIIPLGIAGAALATVIAQALATLLCFLYIRRRYPLFLVKRSDFRLEKELFVKQLTMGISMGLMNSIVSIGTLVLQSAVNQLGKMTIAAHTAARKIVEMLMQPFISLGIAVTTFISQNLGANQLSRILEGVKKSVWVSFIWAAAVIVLSFSAASFLIGFLIDGKHREVVEPAVFYTQIMSLFYFALALLFLYRSALQGLGNGTVPIVSSIIEMLVKIIVTFTLVPACGYLGVALAEPISWCLMAIVLVGCFYRNMRVRKTDQSTRIDR